MVISGVHRKALEVYPVDAPLVDMTVMSLFRNTVLVWPTKSRLG